MVGYSITLDHDIGDFEAGTRFVVMQKWRGQLKLQLYAGCGPSGELKWIDPEDVTLWRPVVGRRYRFIPDGPDFPEAEITALETSGPGWHDAKFEGREHTYSVHDQELEELER